METDSTARQHREFTFLETAEELVGDLQVPDHPEVSAGYADIYHGIWTSARGEQVEVAIKELKTIIPKDRQTDTEALKMRRDTVSISRVLLRQHHFITTYPSIQRLRREVFVWSRTAHPNLHPLLGYRSQPRPRLISPWCRHGNLTHYIRNNPSLSRLDKLRLVR